MAYLAVNKHGDEVIFRSEPTRETSYWEIFDYYSEPDYGVELPKGTIYKLIGRDLTWDDEPVLLK